MEEISRKKFLRVCGTIAAGGSIAGVSGILLKDRKTVTTGALQRENGNGTATATRSQEADDAATSPYRRIASFEASGMINAFEEHDHKIYVAASNAITVYDYHGKELQHFPVGGEVIRDMAIREDGVYILHPAKISVYTAEGTLQREWEACSDLSDYCSFTLAPDAVFVTDRENKHICKYTSEGQFVKFISSPNVFIIPSLTFGIEYINGILYCSNSGRHQIESYTPDGEYLGAFGQPGGAPGRFAGCCNPVHLSYNPNGEIITSEKGNPRISCYSGDGTFRSVLLDSKALGGGHAAYDVKVQNERLFVAGKDRVSVFAYDPALAANTAACSACGIACPLKVERV
jgi:hypothetical protein